MVDACSQARVLDYLFAHLVTANWVRAVDEMLSADGIGRHIIG